MAPKSMADKHVKDMFNDTRKGMNISESKILKFTEYLQEDDNSFCQSTTYENPYCSV